MFYSLPAETVFEAKERTRRATVLLFILLTGLYIFFFNLLLVSGALMLRGIFQRPGPIEIGALMTIATATAGALATVHFFYVRSRGLEDLLEEIGAKPADPRDDYHSQFIHLLQEAEAATGIRGIRPVILPTTGLNAFSLQDGRGKCAIGATEGLLAKLSRQELSAVVAHEAAHLVHEDSQLVTTACFLFSVFEKINAALGRALSGKTGYYGSFDRRDSNRGGGFSLLIVVLWFISGAGYIVTRLISMAISREREYLADTDGVSMCKDPLALAESLYKISRRFRGGSPDAYASLFILSPSESALDDSEGFIPRLFSNHPPVSQRLSKLLGWARADLKTLQEIDGKEESNPAASAAPLQAPEGPGYMAYRENQWVGPYTPLQLLSTGNLNPATWVCPAGGQEVVKASEAADLLPFFQQQVQGAVSQSACPRCKVSLVTSRYEHAEVEQCAFCKGYLLRAGVLERIISREEVTFSVEEIQKAKIWRDAQRGPLLGRDSFPAIKCPHCQNLMGKTIHSMLTQVVLDRCCNDACRAIWCDGGELETIQMVIEDAHKKKA